MVEIRHKWYGELIAEVDVETLAGATLRDLQLYEAGLRNADLSGARLISCCLDGADLTGRRSSMPT